MGPRLREDKRGATKKKPCGFSSVNAIGSEPPVEYQLGPGLDPAQGDGRHLPEPDG